MPGPWPNSQDYNEAVQNPGFAFSDPDLRAAEAVTNTLGIPQACAGGFADVYQLRSTDGQSWAVKCFTKRADRRRERYAAISTRLRQAGLPFTVGFEFIEQGIRIQGEWYPVLKMDWVEGHTLANFVRDNLNRPKLLRSLLKIWLQVEPRLHHAQIAHGDLQHGNVMLIPGRTEDKLSLKLIDYDGLWFSSLNEQPSGEIGHPSYQHPERLQRGMYSADVDRFPHLVIAAALRCLASPSGSHLWETYDTGENLLFSQSDFRRPRDSAVLHELWASGYRDQQAWIGHLILASQAPLEATPRLSTLARKGKIVALSADEEEAVRQCLGLSSRKLRAATPSEFEAEGIRADHDPRRATSGTSGSPPHSLEQRDLPTPVEAGTPDWNDEPARRGSTRRSRQTPWLILAVSAGSILCVWLALMLVSTRLEFPAGSEPIGLVSRTEETPFRIEAHGDTALVAGQDRKSTSLPRNPVPQSVDQAPISVTATRLGVGTRTGQEWSGNSLTMKLVWCEPGKFTMGSPPDEAGRGFDEDQVEVTLTHGFWLGKYEVTQRQWKSVMESTPWKQGYIGQDLEDAERPATYVSWYDAVAFCDSLTASEQVAGRLPDDWAYMLPTEAQWEFACRAGTKTRFSFGDDERQLGDYVAGSGGRIPFPVGQKLPNAWGLHDMSGNVAESCRDRYSLALQGGANPAGSASGPLRVHRGASSGFAVTDYRSASRFAANRIFEGTILGFRVAAVPAATIDMSVE